MGIDIGHRYRAAFRKHTNPWGPNAAVALGAGDGFEFNQEALKANVEAVMNEGLYGAAFRRAGSPGNQKPAGDLGFDLYYRDGGSAVGGAHQIIACGMGVDAVTALGGGATKHALSLLNKHAGIYGSLVFGSDEVVVEHPLAKVAGFKLAFDQSKQRSLCTPNFLGWEKNMNVGAADATAVVTTAAAANGVATIANQPATPSPLKITLTGVTELITTIVYLNIRGDQVTEVYTRSTGGLVYTTLQYCAAGGVISITRSAIAGAGNFTCTTSNGINNATTLSAVTTDTFRDAVLFSQLKCYFNAQGGADFVTTQGSVDEQFIDSIELTLNLNMDQRITSQFGYRSDEPSTGGGGRPSVGIMVKHSAFTDRNRRHFYDMLSKSPLKAKIVITGPQIAASGFAHSWTIYLNGIQFAGEDPSVGGPGVLPVSFTGECNAAVAAPTGFPGGVIQPLYMEIVNGLTTTII